MKGKLILTILSLVLVMSLGPVRSLAAEMQEGAADFAAVNTAEEPGAFTPVPSPEADCTPREAFEAYKTYLQYHKSDMGGRYTVNNDTVDLGANLAFWDVTGDNIPEMLAVRPHYLYSMQDKMSLYVFSYKNGSVQELLQADGNSALAIFWDQTFPHQTYDSVCFSVGKTLYVLTLLREYEGGYSAQIEWIYRISYNTGTGRIVTDEVLKAQSVNGEKSCWVNGASASPVEYDTVRNGIVNKADQGILNPEKGPMGSSDRAYKQLSISPDSYLGMTYEEALALLTEQCSLEGWQKIDGKWYYFNDDGTVAVGWKKISGKWYRFDAAGVMQKGWQKISGKWYYFESGGAMVTGWQKISSKWYYFESSGVMKTGWLNLNGKYYHLASDGSMQTGWQKIKDVWYFFKPSGVMAAKEWYDGYYLNANGSWTYQYKASWKQNAKGWWFGDTSGWYAKNCSIMINDKQYTFDASGYWVK